MSTEPDTTDDPESRIEPALRELMRKVLRRMVATYGRRFWAQYQGVKESDVRLVWARELSGYMSRQASVSWAFENLPEEPMNAIAFRNLCRRAPLAVVPTIEAPPVDPAVLAEAMESARQAAKTKAASEYPRVAWAERIVRRHEAGERLSPGVVAHARAAMHRPGNVVDPV